MAHELTPNSYTAANSSGVAAGLSFEDALLRALYEAIERDAFMLVWLNRMRMPRVDLRTIPGKYRERILAIEMLDYKIHFVDITVDLTPVMLAIAVSESVRPSLALGAGSGARLEQAIGKALSEVEQQLYWAWRRPEIARSISDPKEVRNVLDHMALYASPEHLSKANFLWTGELRPFRQSGWHSEDILAVAHELKQHGIEIAVLDVTPPYLKAAGVWVIRAIPLGLVPISFGYGTEPLGTERIQRMVGRKTPWPGAIPFTHPFA